MPEPQPSSKGLVSSLASGGTAGVLASAARPVAAAVTRTKSALRRSTSDETFRYCTESYLPPPFLFCSQESGVLAIKTGCMEGGKSDIALGVCPYGVILFARLIVFVSQVSSATSAMQYMLLCPYMEPASHQKLYSLGGSGP